MKRETIDIKASDLRQDYISVDLTTVISSEGEIFKIGDKVIHNGDIQKNVGVIQLFDCNRETMDIIAITDRGKARICFLYHSEN